MRLLVVSHTSHFRCGAGVVGWGPTVREIDALSELFDEIVHVATLHPSAPPASSLPYRSPRVRLALVPPAGGSGPGAKLGILLRYPAYLRAILRELRTADAVHVRCPANIALLAILLLAADPRPIPRWVKYAGNWMPDRREALSYRIQRWWLRRGLHRGVVTVNGDWPDQPPHVFSFLNPSLAESELRDAASVAESKTLEPPVRLLFVGRLDEEKGAGRALEVLASVRREGIDAWLDVVGDGPQRDALRELALALAVSDRTRFHGFLSREALRDYYAAGHILLLPSESSEGWPKVLSEAMAYGVVPLAGAVSSIPQILERVGSGGSFAPSDVEAFSRAVHYYVRDPDRWRVESRAGARSATGFGYRAFLDRLGAMFRDRWGVQLPSSVDAAGA